MGPQTRGPHKQATMYTQPTGFLLTWTCYGTWLHGDERTSVRREVKKHRWPVMERDPAMLATMLRKLAQSPYLIDAPARGVVEDTVAEVCNPRKWQLAACNVRTNHVHVVACGSATPEKMLGDLKARCTRNLRDNGLVARDRKVWTDGGSTVYLWNAKDLAGAVDYVTNQQGPRLPGG